MADLLTSSYHAVGSYGAMYGCISYKYTNYDTYTRIYIYWLGEGLKTTASDAASPYYLTTSATIKGEVLIGSTSKKSWSSTASGTRSGNATYSSYVWFKAGGSDANYVDITRTTAAQTATIKVTYTVSGYSSKTGTTTITVPAKETCTITYNSNGGSGSMDNTTYTYASSGTTTLRANTFSKSDYTFAGWNLDGSATVKYTDGQNWNLSNRGNYTLYAVWKKNIAISYDANGGSGTVPATQNATVYNNTTSQSFKIATNTLTRTNYKFVSWNTKNDGSGTTYQPNDSKSFSKSTILYAIWESTFVPPELTISSIRDPNNTGIATIELNWTKGSIGGNSINTTYYKIQYKKYDASGWSGDTEYTSTTETSHSRSLTGLDDVQYDVKVSIYSAGYSSTVVSKIDFISAAFYTIDITADGKGIGLLTTAPDKGIALGDYITTDVTLYKSSGDSPSLIFQRGTLTDSYNDWRIYDREGYLRFGHRGSGSTDWPTSQEWSISTSGKFSGYIDWTHIGAFANSVDTSGIPVTPAIFTPKQVIQYKKDADSSDALFKAIQYADDGTTEQCAVSLNAAASNNHGVWSHTQGKWLAAYLSNGTPYFNGAALVDQVIEQGTKSTSGGVGASWTYRKWKSGYLEAWGWKKYDSIDYSTSAGTGYYKGIGTFYFPFTMAETPYCLASVDFANVGGVVTSSLSTTSVYVSVWSASNTARGTKISVYIKGKYA